MNLNDPELGTATLNCKTGVFLIFARDLERAFHFKGGCWMLTLFIERLPLKRFGMRTISLSHFPRLKAWLSSLRNQTGSATMEYVIVSTFAALLSIAAITFVARMVKSKVDTLSDKVGIEATEFDLDLGLSP